MVAICREAPELYRTIAGMERVLVRRRVANINSWISLLLIVFSEQTVLVDKTHMVRFPCFKHRSQVCLDCRIRSSMRTDVRYTPSDCFETFPFPLPVLTLDVIGETYHPHRRRIMHSRQEGLTKTYNRFHNPDESAADIQKLRDLHVEMDKAVAAAYGWDDLDLGHGFHETKQGIRFTISESARREVLARLLKLNHERYAEEVTQGLHDKKGKAKTPKAGSGRKSKASSDAPPLFGDDEDDPDPAEGARRRPGLRTGATPIAIRPEPTARFQRRPAPPNRLPARRPSTRSRPTPSWRRSARPPGAGAGWNATNS